MRRAIKRLEWMVMRAALALVKLAIILSIGIMIGVSI